MIFIFLHRRICTTLYFSKLCAKSIKWLIMGACTLSYSQTLIMPWAQLVKFRPCPLFSFSFSFSFLFAKQVAHSKLEFCCLFTSCNHFVIFINYTSCCHQWKARCKFAFTILQNKRGNALTTHVGIIFSPNRNAMSIIHSTTPFL